MPIRDLKGYSELEQMQKRLIDASSNPREKAFISTLGKTGIRISEATLLKETEIDFKRGTLTIVHLKERMKLKCPDCGEILGKRHLFCPGCGNKVGQALREKVSQRRQRTIPVDHNTLQLIDEYLRWRRKFPYRGPLVFPFTRQRGWQLIEKLGRRIGVKGLHPESLRHLLAARWINKGLDVKKLQFLMGSANTATHPPSFSFEQLQSEYQKLWETGRDEV